jgi:hypothetical protein
MKINKGHYLEITDRIAVTQANIESNLRNHPVIEKDKKLQKLIDKAQYQLAKAYQITGSKV